MPLKIFPSPHPNDASASDVYLWTSKALLLFSVGTQPIGNNSLSTTLDITMKYCTLMVLISLQRLDVLITLSVQKDELRHQLN